MSEHEIETGGGFSLAGRRVLVTGASSGIGRAVAELAARLGASVVLNGRNAAALEAARAALATDRRQAHVVAAGDLSRSEELDAVMAAAVAGGKLNGLVHAAGVCPVAPVGSVSYAAFEEAMRINCGSFFGLMRHCSRRRNAADGFSAVVVSSVSSEAGWAGGAVYSATKGAVSAAVRSLAVELAPKGMRVNAVSPSNIKTPMFESITALNDEAALAALKSRQPLGFGRPEQVAAPVCFLLGDGASFITGVNLPVDGGYLAQ